MHSRWERQDPRSSWWYRSSHREAHQQWHWHGHHSYRHMHRQDQRLDCWSWLRSLFWNLLLLQCSWSQLYRLWLLLLLLQKVSSPIQDVYVIQWPSVPLLYSLLLQYRAWYGLSAWILRPSPVHSLSKLHQPCPGSHWYSYRYISVQHLLRCLSRAHNIHYIKTFFLLHESSGQRPVLPSVLQYVRNSSVRSPHEQYRPDHRTCSSVLHPQHWSPFQDLPLLLQLSYLQKLWLHLSHDS